jgi:putative transposase
MPYKQTTTRCVVRLVTLRGLSATTLSRCQPVRTEAGRLWTDLVRRHAEARAQHGQWLSAGDLEHATTGGQYALHSQSIQALCQTFAANVATAMQLRQQEVIETEQIQTAYPHHPKPYQTVIWKDQAIQVLPAGHLRLPCGGQRVPLLLPLPEEYRTANLRRAELTWRADHVELALTIATGTSLPAPLAGVEGEVGGAVAGHRSGRGTHRRPHHHPPPRAGALRSAPARLQARPQSDALHPAGEGEPLSTGLAPLAAADHMQGTASAKLYRQQREILHQAARKAVGFCQVEGVTRIAVGDVRDLQTGVSLGRVSNQKISQWPHGQFVRYLTEKAQQVGIRVEWIDERLSTRTGSYSGHVRSSSPRGRRFGCPGCGCGARVHRDVNGSANICSKAVYGAYAKVHADTVTYRRPIVVVPRHRPK